MIKLSSALACLGVGLTLALPAQAQIHIPVADISLAFPSSPTVNVQLGSTPRSIIPSPFVIGGAYDESALWFCMDPLQTMFTKTSGLPSGATLKFGSDNPANYDKWTASAPGLSAARLQNLADLFHAYAPSRTDALVGAALQLVVPELTNELNGYSFSLLSGKFKAWSSKTAGNAVITLAQEMIDRLDDADVAGFGDVSALRFLIDGKYETRKGKTYVQDLVGYVPNFTPIPEPSTYALFGLGVLVPVIALRLRRRAKENSGALAA
ncbi:MAG: PEP-CTERM sorting domain-containing protein [Opitutus sp.]|nr:PEP-CTERM sorting domain-containing protein [Opitutus sp.]